MTNEPTRTPANGTTSGTTKASEATKGPLPIRLDDKLPACPFCGTHLNEVVSIPYDSSRNSRAIMCTKCGAQGPTRWPPTSPHPLDLAEARAAWTARAQPK
jgi:transcription elongation factor Elf1